MAEEPTPGKMLREEFLIPLGITAYRLAKEIGISQAYISDLLSGQRGIGANMALRLSAYFQTTPQFWMNLQQNYDLAEARRKYAGELAKIKPADLPHLRDMEPEVLAEIEAEQESLPHHLRPPTAAQ